MLDASESTLQFTKRQKQQERERERKKEEHRIRHCARSSIGFAIDTSEKRLRIQKRELKRKRSLGDATKCVTTGDRKIVVRPPSTFVSFSFQPRIGPSARTTMKLSISAAILCVLVVVLLPETTYARPTEWLLSRQKRLSDQRLAEIETMLALQKLKGIVVPVGYGKVDPAILGRRRRSIPEDDLRQLQRLLLFVGRDAESIAAQQPDQFRPLPWEEDPQEVQRGYQLI